MSSNKVFRHDFLDDRDASESNQSAIPINPNQGIPYPSQTYVDEEGLVSNNKVSPDSSATSDHLSNDGYSFSEGRVKSSVVIDTQHDDIAELKGDL